MKISSALLIALFSFASFTKGVPVNNPTPETKVTEPQNDVHEQPQEQAGVNEVLVKNLIFTMCTQRMRYKEFANIKWTDKWTVPQPPTTARPAPEFEKFVKECVSKEIVGVKTWAHLKLLSGYHWGGTEHIELLCEFRCQSKNFGGLEVSDKDWSRVRSEEGLRDCILICRKNNYGPLLEKLQNQYTAQVIDVKIALTLLEEIKGQVKKKKATERPEKDETEGEEAENNMDQFPNESMLQRFAWVACAYRMIHLNFAEQIADETWDGQYEKIPESTDPKFVTYVSRCVPLVLPRMGAMANEVKSLPQGKNKVAKFVKMLCSYRCGDKDSLAFEGIRFTGQWPPLGTAAREKCMVKCAAIYKPLLRKVKEPWDEKLEENKDLVSHALQLFGR